MALTNNQRAAAQSAWVAALSRAKGCTELTRPQIGPLLDAVEDNIAALPGRVRYSLGLADLEVESNLVSDADLLLMIRAVFDAREG